MPEHMLWRVNGFLIAQLTQLSTPRKRVNLIEKDDCHLCGRKATQAQNSAYGLLEPIPPAWVIDKVTTQTSLWLAWPLCFRTSSYLSRRSCSISQRMNPKRCCSSSISRYSVFSVTWFFI